MILVNGVARDEIRATDRGLAYGDGVFRTLLVRNGKPLHWPRQYAKLAHDCAVLDLPAPEEHLLADAVVRSAQGMSYAAAKMIVTRGTGARGYRYTGAESPTCVVLTESLPDLYITHRRTGVRVRRCKLRLAAQPALAGVKHLNRLENVLARAEWNDADIAEGLLSDDADRVIGGTMTNVFVVREGRLATPQLDRCGVAGVTRERAIEAASRLGIPCSVSTVTWTDLSLADEVFLVNSLAGVWPVCAIDGEARTCGPVTRALQTELEQEDDAQVD